VRKSNYASGEMSISHASGQPAHLSSACNSWPDVMSLKRGASDSGIERIESGSIRISHETLPHEPALAPPTAMKDESRETLSLLYWLTLTLAPASTRAWHWAENETPRGARVDLLPALGREKRPAPFDGQTCAHERTHARTVDTPASGATVRPEMRIKIAPALSSSFWLSLTDEWCRLPSKTFYPKMTRVDSLRLHAGRLHALHANRKSMTTPMG